MTKSLPLRLLITSALAIGSLFIAPALRAGDEVGVPKDAPVFKVTLPDGWEAKNDTPIVNPYGTLNNRKGLYVDFKKLSGDDEKAVMAATEAAAKQRV